MAGVDKNSESSSSTAVTPARRDVVWVCSTYFAEGLPFMIVRVLSGVFFTEVGVKERYIGYLNYLGLPWNLKFLWAPLLDGWATKRSWQIVLQVFLGAVTVAIGTLSYIASSAPAPEVYLTPIAILFILSAILAATNDTAIDGYYLEAIPRQADQAALSGYRVLAYRLAVVFARSGIVALVAYWVSSSVVPNKYHGWAYGFFLSGATLWGLAILHWLILPRVLRPPLDTAHYTSHLTRARSVFWNGFRTYLKQPQVGLILTFIIVYKMGDEILFSMVTPFMLRELKITTEQYAWIGGVIGAAGAIVGAMVGGAWIKRVGLKRAMWPLTLLMNLNIWLYVWLSFAKPDPTTSWGFWVIGSIHGVEQIAAGLGSAALLVFLLTTCSKEFKATHYAVGSAIMSIPGTLIGGQAGRMVEVMGYTWLYVLAFIAALPGMALLPFVPIKEERS